MAQTQVTRRQVLVGIGCLGVSMLTACGGTAATTPAVAPTGAATAPVRATALATPATTSTSAPTAGIPSTPSSAGSPTAKPAAGARQKVSMVYPGPGTLIFLPFEVARTQGFFTDQGIDIDITYSKGGPPAVSALTSNSIDFAGASMDLALNSFKQSKIITMVASLTRLPAFAVVGKVATLKELQGKKVGISNVGAGDQLILQYLLKKQGADLTKVEYVAVGPDEAKINALSANQIDGAIVQEPALTILKGKGTTVLANLYDRQQATDAFGGDYQFTGLVTRPDVIKEKAALVRSMVLATANANRFVATHNGEQITMNLPDQAIIGGDKAAFAKIVDAYKQAIYSPDAKIQPDDVATVARVQQESGALTGAIPDMTQFFTNSFLEGAS